MKVPPIPATGNVNELQTEMTPSQLRQTSSCDMEDKLYQAARDEAERTVIEGEQFKATINTPRGNSFAVSGNQFFDSKVKDDDEFFHITCHVDPYLVEKIAKGEYVELDKLLSKQRYNPYGKNEPKNALVFRKGRPVFITHTNKNRMVSGLRKWEQAFRVYATIYSQANPDRAAEIWQYVFTINTAAASYSWQNVAEYDFAFRQMMSKNPK